MGGMWYYGRYVVLWGVNVQHGGDLRRYEAVWWRYGEVLGGMVALWRGIGRYGGAMGRYGAL